MASTFIKLLSWGSFSSKRGRWFEPPTLQKEQVVWFISRRWGQPTISSQSSPKNAWHKHIYWRHWQATCMLEPTQGCRTGQIQTHCPTNITQGISSHPAAYFSEISWYWKHQTFGKKQMFPQFTKKSEESDPSNYRPISPTLNLFIFDFKAFL